MAFGEKTPIKHKTFLILLLQGFFSTSLGTFEITFPKGEEHVIDANTDVTFSCVGDSFVEWSYPDPRTNNYSTIFTNTTEQDYSSYVSTLYIRNASYLDTGFYTCKLFDGNDEEKQIYLYVRDENNWSALGTMKTLNVYEDEPATIPCRPTSPDIKVKLEKETGDLIEGNESHEYDPKYGFTIETNLSRYDPPMLLSCIFTVGNENKNYTVIVNLQDIRSDPVEVYYVIDNNKNRTVEGQTVNLTCAIEFTSFFVYDWKFPNKNIKNEKKRVNITYYDDGEIRNVNLLIYNATMEDKGLYQCIATDAGQSHTVNISVNIYDKNVRYLKLHEDSHNYVLSAIADEKSTRGWNINVTAHPTPKIQWFNNKGQLIDQNVGHHSLKYNINSRDPDRALIQIHNISITDRGYYELRSYHDNHQPESLKLFLNISGKPKLDLQKQDFYVINKPASANCSIKAYPQPEIHWTMMLCNDDGSCTSELIPSEESRGESDYEFESRVIITPSSSGMLTCHANNTLGYSNITVNVLLTDVDHGFGIWSPDDILEGDNRDIKLGTGVIGETITLYCGATKSNFSEEINWNLNQSDSFLSDSDHYRLDKSDTMYSYRSILIINSAAISDNGNYTCTAVEMWNGRQSYKSTVLLNFKEPQAPVITESNLSDDIFESNIPDQVSFFCKAYGTPRPKVTWLKDGDLVSNSNQNRILVTENNQRLIFTYTLEEDEGIYTCRAENQYGKEEKSVTLQFRNKPKIFTFVVAGVAIAGLIVLVLVFIIIIVQRQKQKLLKELKSIGFMDFEKGAVENLNPELGIDDQAELLPYDNKFEFPREKLKLGKQLGAGAFGIVVKAEASGIISREDTTTVAVKMVKRNADSSHIKSLVSELKIMVHLGNHLNVVNLLGACTKDTAKTRELLVIVEYCRFGNLHNFLIRHRQHFINQIDSKTGKIDFSIGIDMIQRTFSISSYRSDMTNTSSEYRTGYNSTMTGDTNRTSTTTVCTTPTGDTEDLLLNSINSVQPDWRTNYKGDYKGVVKMIATRDLISWVFQVARGMEYLSSRKVLHGDLAARNILLAENNVVKICDFGLAKSIYKDDNYQKKGDGLLPVKWMAIESIRDRIFSTQSDVWSFGIVLWEFFSLARTPYPGMEANERLYQKLVEGYRMDCPKFCTKQIYQIMLDCWHPNPIYRPSFTKLASDIGLMLEDSVRQHYIDLNDPYLKMNTSRLEKQEDYLAMLSPPDFINLSSPNNYINEPVINDTATTPTTNDENSTGYLCMKPTDIFSPSPHNTSTFVFDTNINRKPTENCQSIVEMEPMLGGNNESDCESLPNSPISTTSFSNPSYHVLSKINPTLDGEKPVIHCENNYVNMPKNKSALYDSSTKEKDADECFTNNYQNDYVNSNSRDWEKVAI